MITEQIQNRIETLTATLPQAVQSSNGAQFALMLSLISANQEIYTPQAASAVGDGSFQLPQAEANHYPDPNEFYTPPVVDRLNHAVNGAEWGEYAYLVSQVDLQSRIPRSSRIATDQFEQVALQSSGRMMLETIEQSRRSFSAHA